LAKHLNTLSTSWKKWQTIAIDLVLLLSLHQFIMSSTTFTRLTHAPLTLSKHNHSCKPPLLFVSKTK
jgi:hypothetical protein